MNTSIYKKTSRRVRPPFGRLLPALSIMAVYGTAQAQFVMPAPDDHEHSGWGSAVAQGVIVKGREATFQQRHQMPSGVSGGLHSLYWETFPTRELTFKMEARSIFDQHDHHISAHLYNPDGGFVRGGFRQTRHWFDGSGGYFPPTGAFFRLWNDQLHLDRGEAWIEAGIANPDQPSVMVGYTHQYRRGLKDSTIWGRTGGANTGGAGNRGIVPSFREIDESRHIVHGRAEHTVGNTDVGLGLRYEVTDQENHLNIRQFPGQPTEQHIRQRDGVDSDMFTTHAWTTTELREKVRFSTGYIYTRLDNDIFGERSLYNPLAAPADQPIPYFTDMDGATQLRQHVANISFTLGPWEHFLIVPSLRFEKQEVDSLVNYINNQGAPNDVDSERSATNLSQRLELRYSGLPRWHFFARGDWMQGDGDLREIGTAVPGNARDTDFDRKQQKYTLGTHWNPNRLFTTALQYSYEIRENDYEHLVPARVGRHPAFIQNQDFETHAFNIRLTTRPATRVTLVSRYDLRLTEIDTRGSEDVGGDQLGRAKIQSGDIERHIISQSATWMPVDRLYLQANGSYSIGKIDTPVNQIHLNPNTGQPETWTGLVAQSRNDYLSSSLAAVYAWSPKTDLNVDYFFLTADNFGDVSPQAVPYGTSETEHGIRLGANHRLHDNFVISGGYAFFIYREDTTGGRRDYDAHLVYAGLTARF